MERKTYHFFVAYDGDEITDFIELSERDIVALGVKPVNCDSALRIFGVTYREIEKSDLRERKFRKRKLREFLDRAYENNWNIDYVSSWVKDIEFTGKRTEVYKHHIGDLTGHGEDPCSDY